MSCTTGDRSCEVPRRRGALMVLGMMAVIFLILSVLSFVDSRGQVVPSQVVYEGFTADDGKRVFQAYNCMGCHTIVGNGGYFAPDLTNSYAQTGPAWLEAFLPSAASWPTEAALQVRLASAEQLAAAGVTSFDEYLAKYPGTAERLERRGGEHSNMPNLSFRTDEVAKLIAFLKYTSEMNTEGWPPEVQSGSLESRLQMAYGGPTALAAATVSDGGGADVALSPAQEGEQLVRNYGCIACHSTDGSTMIGPSWGGLYGTNVSLESGETVSVDEEYLIKSILDPNAQVVQGYQVGIMPAYQGLLSEDQVDAMVAYLISLGGE